MSETAIVREYGNGIYASGSATLESPEVKEVLNRDMGKMQKLLDYLKVVQFVEPFHLIEGPADKLRRTKHFGWYGKVAAPGLDAFAEHFKCHKEHTPMYPSLKYVWEMFHRYWTVTRSREDDF